MLALRLQPELRAEPRVGGEGDGGLGRQIRIQSRRAEVVVCVELEDRVAAVLRHVLREGAQPRQVELRERRVVAGRRR